jgi:hypothetical protein
VGVTWGEEEPTRGRHEFFPQPDSNPPWCFCRNRDCSGWLAYVTWYQGQTGQAGEPDGPVIRLHRHMTELLADMVRYYSSLFGINMDVNTALDLAGLDLAAAGRDDPAPPGPR